MIHIRRADRFVDTEIEELAHSHGAHPVALEEVIHIRYVCMRVCV
jgi:hypothetical protein